jgi:Ni/Co efflux regulator RcnB
MKKFLVALFAFSILAVPMAEAGSGYKKPKRHGTIERHHNGGYKPHRPHRGRGDRYVRRHGNNYYYDNRHNYNNNNGGGRYFYNDPYFWGGVAGGLIGGAIIRDQYYYDEPECETIWTQVYVPGEGYRNVQRVVCD